MKRRLLSLALCLVTLLSLTPSVAHAEVLSGFTSKVDYDNTDPNRYSIEIDLVNQVITVYDQSGNAMLQSLCTTGSDKTPTGSGKFRLGDLKERFGYFVAYGEYAQYWTQVVRGVYIHSVMYKSKKLSSMSKSAYKNLGKNVSHGCVRVLPHVAQWIYYNCPPGTLCNIVKNKAANPYLVSRLKSTIPDYSSYQQPSDSHATPSEVPATVKLNDVPVRSGFSNSKDKTVAKLNYGDHVELLQIGAEWCKVRTPAGKLGYVKTMYLTCDPDNVRTTQSYAATGKTYVYSDASRSSETLTTIPKGKTVNVTEQAGSGWLYGSYNGVSGYMRTKYVKLTDTLLYPNPDGSYPDGTSVATVPQSQTQTQTGTGSASAPSSGARVKSGIIANFRSGPGSEYGVIAELEPCKDHLRSRQLVLLRGKRPSGLPASKLRSGLLKPLPFHPGVFHRGFIVFWGSFFQRTNFKPKVSYYFTKAIDFYVERCFNCTRLFRIPKLQVYLRRAQTRRRIKW